MKKLSIKNDYQYYYRFSDGSFLYNYYVTSCSKNTCYENSLKIYNPLTKKEFILYSDYKNSDSIFKHNIKVTKISNTIYKINVETVYTQTSRGYAYKYYEEYKYDITKTNQEDAIKVVYSVYKELGSSSIFASSKNYCRDSYSFNFLAPKKYSTKTYWEDDKRVSFSRDDFCYSNRRKGFVDLYDDENSQYETYMKDYENTVLNSVTDDYGKYVNVDDTKLIDTINKYATKNNLNQEVSGLYSSSSLHEFIRNKSWENDEMVVIPFACRLDKDEDYSECFLRLYKSIILDLTSSS